ncbi:hypothetical protein Pmgp_00752 [Pelotomaculum propionicicum]|uniref:Uncharacterized protein n=1 Tax=Pelotomaculum propionicicum TaxID=258475 RepID=A0A4Y7RVN4_9FIRM|nr:hypothetical protein Pmgp_00752 [Pelotomaculum propionicicum]
MYLEHLETSGYSVSHRLRVKSAVSGFATDTEETVYRDTK